MPPVNCVSQPGRKAVPGDLFSGALSPELGWTSGTHLTGEGKTTWTGLCSVGDVSVVFPSPVRWVPEVHPSSGDRAPDKRSPGTAVCPGWETQFTGGQASEPPTGKNRPYCPWRSTLPECVTPDWCLTDLSSATAWPSKPGPRPTWRRVWVRICKNCQGLQQ